MVSISNMASRICGRDPSLSSNRIPLIFVESSFTFLAYKWHASHIGNRYHFMYEKPNVMPKPCRSINAFMRDAWRCVAAIAILSLIMPINGYATAYIPSDGNEVLERLPARNAPEQRALQQARAALAANPNDLGAGIALARRYIDTWRDGGDPRYLGYAQATLKPWWNLKDPPLEARVMRATLLQSTHHFLEALVDLDAVVKQDPRNAQAWLTRATVLQVLGDYPQAALSCTHLNGLAPNLVTVTCLSGVQSLNGHAETSYRQLDGAVNAAGNAAEPAIRLWALTLLAEMSVRRGDGLAAQRHFEEAMAVGTPDNYLLAAYADFLLDAKQPAQVVKILKDRTQVDALLLRYAIALKALSAPEAPRFTDVLMQRFAAARMRGDTIHQREQARFELDLRNDPAAALTVAQQNWSVQKEPADTLLLLQSAAAAGNREAARPVIEWVRKVRLEDKALEPLIARLKEPAR